MSGTDLAYAATAVCGTDLGYAATRRGACARRGGRDQCAGAANVRPTHMLPCIVQGRIAYAVHGTDVAYGATSGLRSAARVLQRMSYAARGTVSFLSTQCPRYETSGTKLYERFILRAYRGMLLQESGTELRYAATTEHASQGAACPLPLHHLLLRR
eukprot:3409377-Rhodomonas_salina.1